MCEPAAAALRDCFGISADARGPRDRRPDDTAWEDGTFKLSVEFTEEYPNKAPTVKFLTKMFHPNSTRSPSAAAARACCSSCAPLTRLVPPFSLRRRLDLPRHPTEPVEPDLRYFGHPDVDPVAALRPKPKLTSKLRGSAPLPGESASHANPRTQHSPCAPATRPAPRSGCRALLCSRSGGCFWVASFFLYRRTGGSTSAR